MVSLNKPGELHFLVHQIPPEKYRVEESKLPKPYKLLDDFDFSPSPG